MIPKIIHHVWIGPNPLPEAEKSYIESWKKHHPDWNFMFWDNESIKTINLNENCYQAIQNLNSLYVFQSDIIRYIVVNLFGGFYIDTDIECFKNIDILRTNQLEFIGLRPHRGNWITNAFFGSQKNKEALSLAISKISLNKPLTNRKRNIFGPVFLTRHVRTAFHFTKDQTITDKVSDKCKILDHNFWSTHNPDRFCRHYFRASWRK